MLVVLFIVFHLHVPLLLLPLPLLYLLNEHLLLYFYDHVVVHFLLLLSPLPIKILPLILIPNIPYTISHLYSFIIPHLS